MSDIGLAFLRFVADGKDFPELDILPPTKSPLKARWRLTPIESFDREQIERK